MGIFIFLELRTQTRPVQESGENGDGGREQGDKKHPAIPPDNCSIQNFQGIFLRKAPGDTVHVSSTPFVLHPDKLAQIMIVDPDGTPVTDTLNLTNPIIIIARGYDKYGNSFGDIIGNWSVTDSLHQITGPVNGSSIAYDPRSVKNNESGYIIVDRNGVRDSIFVIIKGPNGISKDAAFIHPDRFIISTSGGITRIHIPLRGTHLITAYSLSGSVVSSLRTNANNAQIRLPRGVFIVTVETMGSAARFETKVFNQ